jgi:hypothetical protein
MQCADFGRRGYARCDRIAANIAKDAAPSHSLVIVSGLSR